MTASSRRTAILLRVARWMRSYLVPAALIVLVAWVALKAFSGDVSPNPEFPPEGYDVVRDTIELEWSRSSEKEKTRLQVVIDDDSFDGKKVVDEDVYTKTYTLNQLEPGRTYFWRVIEKGKTSRSSSFRVAEDAVRY
jgi:hypothetical protein